MANRHEISEGQGQYEDKDSDHRSETGGDFVTTFQLAVKRIRDERKGVFILKHLCGMEECWRIRLGIGKSDKPLIIHY